MELSLVREDGPIYFFDYPSRQGKLWAMSGVVISILGNAWISSFLGKILIFITGGILFGVGVIMFLWRHSLKIDLQKKQLVREAGTWPNITAESKPLSDLQGVVLTLTSSGSGVYATYQPYWFISLQIEGVGRDIGIDQAHEESVAKQKLQMWAQKLKTTAIDLTEELQSSPWKQ